MAKILFSIFIFSSLHLAQQPVVAQNGLAKGDLLKAIPVNKLLNAPGSVASFSTLKKKITILDFFGTWCVPCLKALPQLAKIQLAYKDEVSIILVSNETAAQLTKFINKRPGFLFPLIVDENNEWNNLFQPPALPYTVIIKDGRVIEITEAEKITPELIEGWFKTAANIVNPAQKVSGLKPPSMGISKSENSLVHISQEFIYAAKTGESVQSFISRLSALSMNELRQGLQTDDAKIAFWINVYNAYTQVALKKDPAQYKNRNAFFKNKQVVVAGKKLSLDDVEHGILRRSKIKWSLGYLNKPFPGALEKSLRVARLDYRIHFALNCGAKSCPPIAFYNDKNLDQQLELATKAFLAGEAEYDKDAEIIFLPKLMSWFRADFDGKKGMIRLLKKQSIIPGSASPKIKFKPYDWSLTLNNYSNQQL